LALTPARLVGNGLVVNLGQFSTIMSLQTFGKSALRVAKNYTKGYSDVQAKVREATSNDPWGPSGTQMNEIAQMTYNQFVPLPRESRLLFD
jgi:hypothetical protein